MAMEIIFIIFVFIVIVVKGGIIVVIIVVTVTAKQCSKGRKKGFGFWILKVILLMGFRMMLLLSL
jgi:hypothetical protein